MVAGWRDAGQPGAEDLLIRAYPRGAEPANGDGLRCTADHFSVDIAWQAP